MAFSSDRHTVGASTRRRRHDDTIALIAVVVVVAVTAGCGGGSTNALPTGSEPVDARPGGLHDRDHEPVLADGARRPLGLPRDGRPGRRAEGRSRPSPTTTKPIMGIEALVVHDVVTENGERRRGHVRLVRPGRRREHLVPRRGHEGVRERQAEDDGRLVGGGVDGAAGRASSSRRNPEPGLAYRQEYYEGEAEDAATVLSLDEWVKAPAGTYRRPAP